MRAGPDRRPAPFDRLARQMAVDLRNARLLSRLFIMTKSLARLEAAAAPMGSAMGHTIVRSR